RRRLRRCRHVGVEPSTKARLRLAAKRVHLGQSESEHPQSVDRALLSGTVMLEGTTLSEGRGTTRPLEVLGAPGLDPRALEATMAALAPQWMRGCRLRPCWFEPTFQKHTGALCAGMQIHVEDGSYDHDAFRPWRLVALAL